MHERLKRFLLLSSKIPRYANDRCRSGIELVPDGAKSIQRPKVKREARVVNLEKTGAAEGAFKEQQGLSIA